MLERPITCKVRLLSGREGSRQPQLSLLRRTFQPASLLAARSLAANRGQITRRAIPVDISRIDASAIRLHSGADYYLQQIIADRLDTAERVELSRAYRSLRETFAGNEAIAEINKGLAESKDDITDRQLSLSIDISAKTAWESSLVPHLDDLPFQHVGSGSQNVLKILLALNRSAGDAHVVLIEEPENHLSPGGLNRLIGKVSAKCEGKQVVVATHSSFVLNKLGLDNLILLHGNTGLRLTDLPADTLDYFRKLSGYDTLRLVLAESAVLVEGPSDELIVQRADFDRHGKLPIEAGIDVINVRGLSFKRFLDIAKPLGKPVAVVTDNDGKSPDDVAARFADYTADGAPITIHAGELDDGKTLEPQIVAANELDVLNEILGTQAASSDELAEHMKGHKTASALAIFGSDKTITMPKYIRDAIGDE